MQPFFSRQEPLRMGEGTPVEEHLYHVHARTIFAYIRMHLPGREEAEDLLFEVFLAALEQRLLLERMHVDAQRAWLRRVAHHKLIDYYRHHQRRPVISLDAITETLYEDETYSPERIAISQEELARVRALLAKLPRLQRQVVQLHFLYGLRSSEIAEALGKKEGTVRKLLWRALKRLRTMYVQE